MNRNNTNIIVHLITLSDIFKKGFTVIFKDGELNQYINYNKPFTVSYLTLIKIQIDSVLYTNISQISDNCIIGGWYNNDNNTYYIELNKAFTTKKAAYLFAKMLNQQAIYDIRTDKVMGSKHEL